jgi:hypothetical protein
MTHTRHSSLRLSAIAAAIVLLWAQDSASCDATRWRPTDSPFATANTTATLAGRR